MKTITVATAVFVLSAGMAGCRDGERAPATQPAPSAATSSTPGNRIDLPPTVRQNLGITFAKVEPRRVASTIRVPGRFELLPTARREYRATLSGWVDLLVEQYGEVRKGTAIYQMDSPDWHKLRKQLHEGQAAIEGARAEVTVAEQAKAEAEATVKALEQRIAALAGVEVRRAELETELATRRASVPRLDAEIKVKQAALSEARHDFTLEVDTAAALLGLTPKYLTETVEAEPGDHAEHDEGHKVQRWFAISKVGLTAVGPGVVESLHVTDGTWVEANTLIGTTVDPAALRFRATGMQSDIGRLADGLDAAVVPPQGVGVGPEGSLNGKLKVGLAGDPDQRTIELLMTPEKTAAWAKPGVSALLEIVVEDGGSEQLAIPASAVVRDELTHVYFRRDPKDPDKVIRVEADLGVSDGKWVVVNSGVKAGDEVVLDGVYELKLAGGGKAAGGGHFHADGTWHAEPDK
ncbi:MAG: hypothetical protein AVDCRST_MAG64-2051 [uncultured Phycisphaerae bacterium]|uniref:RND efflux pump membrane fusion protein barrel-sandwich domain-containing protein n=1 Tax=uncultured Phycisphaerae bacterium TaxID=904963 RepID=A0A6J4NLH5_9BACT|nr:MAG: hypothetical protein AVDCRST_MAG64-2051 [uncultured Phycisphaerae bacterium]